MCEDRGLNILQYEEKTRLINSSLHDQEMREGQPSLKGFCDVGFRLENCWTRRRRQVPSSLGHLATNQTNVLLTGTLTNPVTAF